jgi:hypothetical protein
MPGLILRKHADKGLGQRPPQGWDLAGVSVVGDPPEKATLSTRLVAQGKSEGWLETTGDRLVVRPGGPPEDKDRAANVHVFNHFDEIVIKTLDGDVTYRVVHQPDKYADHGEATFPDDVEAFDADDDTKVTHAMYKAGATRVDHFYGLELVKG